MEDNKNPEDFFKTLEQEERIENPFDSEEILFKDENGNIKSIKGKSPQLLDEQDDKSSNALASQAMPPSAQLPRENVNLDKAVGEVMEKSGIHFNDSALENKFKNIVRSRLKGVRDKVSTGEAFVKPIEAGGMGFDREHADKILVAVDQALDQMNHSFRQEVSNKQFAELQAEAEALLKQEDKTDDLPDLKDIGPAAVFKPEPPEEKPAPQKSQEPLPAKPEPQPKTPPPKIPDKPAEPQQASAPPMPRVVSQSSGKPKVEDVKFKPKLTGPVQEIGSMTLVDFRRLAESPEKIIQKIIDKINILEEDSFTEKTKAIRAWKESPVNRLYLELGEESMEQKASIEQVIENRKNNSQPYLTAEEVDAIIQLNRRLRF